MDGSEFSIWILFETKKEIFYLTICPIPFEPSRVSKKSQKCLLYLCMVHQQSSAVIPVRYHTVAFVAHTVRGEKRRGSSILPSFVVDLSSSPVAQRTKSASSSGQNKKKEGEKVALRKYSPFCSLWLIGFPSRCFLFILFCLKRFGFIFLLLLLERNKSLSIVRLRCFE